MNSRQINFFLAPQELHSISDYFHNNNCKILKRRVKSITDRTEYDLKTNKDDLYQVYIYSSEFSNKIEFQFNEDKKYYYVDSLKSYCIEFSIGGLFPYNNRELHRSRLYLVSRYYNEKGLLVSKDSDFINWSLSILNQFKNKYLLKSETDKGVYLSKEAKNWIFKTKATLAQSGLKYIY
jgi:hypothetical protein